MLTLGKFKTSEADETIALPELTGNKQNYDLGAGNLFRVSSNGEHGIGGIIFRGDPNVQLVNIGSNNITLFNEDARSEETNQIITGNGADVILKPDDTAVLVYDNVESKWRLTA